MGGGGGFTAVRSFCQLSGDSSPSPPRPPPLFPLTLSDSSGGGVEGGGGEGGGKSGHICCFAGSLRPCSPGELIRTSRSVGRTRSLHTMIHANRQTSASACRSWLPLLEGRVGSGRGGGGWGRERRVRRRVPGRTMIGLLRVHHVWED